MDILASHYSTLRKPISTSWKTIVQNAHVREDSCAEGSTLLSAAKFTLYDLSLPSLKP